MKKGKFEEGYDERRGNGRPKGSLNKFTNLKTAFLEAFEQTGGVEGLVMWIEECDRNRRQFYQLISKMLPNNLTFKEEQEQITGIEITINGKDSPLMKRLEEDVEDQETEKGEGNV